MPYTGYPTPDNPVTEMAYVCKPIFVPDDPTFIAALYGQIREVCNEYYWRKQGTMTTQAAADYMANAMAMNDLLEACGAGMSCDDMVDCLETSTALQDAFEAFLLANGFQRSGNAAQPTDVTMTTTASAENLLPSGFACEEAAMMAIARAIVQELDAATTDFWQEIELFTNPAEVTVITTDGIPVVDTLNNVPAFIDWAVQTLQEQYVASYDQEVEDELTCAIYCAMRTDCELTFDILLDTYKTFATAEFSAPPTDNNFQSLANWALGLVLTVSTGTVATWHYILLEAMRYGSGTLFNLAGLTSLKSLIAQYASYRDESWVNCDCAPAETPTDYWMIFQNFSQGIGAFYLDFGTQVDNGFMSAAFGAQARLNVEINDLGATFPIVAAASAEQRRGSIGNGTNDFRRIANFPNVNQGGTESVMLAEGFITCNTNDCGNGVILTTPQNGRSLRWSYGVDGAQAYPTNFVTCLKLVVYGNCNTGQVKPAQAVYVSSIPATVGDLFPA